VRAWREREAHAPRLVVVAHPARPAAAPTPIRVARAARRRQRRDGFHWGPFLRRRAINAGRMLIAVPCGWIIGAFLCAILGR
jgi:hypothetical protein